MLALWISLAAAVLPTMIYVVVFYWADRYEREPLWLTTVAFIWGAVPAVIVSLIGELLLGWSWQTATPTLSGVFMEGTIIAPIVEELAKGVALLLIFLLMRHEFDGVLDGIVYGALIGFGFAMTENFLYFMSAYGEGGYSQLTVVILLRAVLFGLNHAFYTSLTGIGLGLARSAQSQAAKFGWIGIGLAAAIVVHGLHNLGAGVAAYHLIGLGFSVLIAIAGIVLVLLAVLLSWRYERNAIRIELAEEVGLLISPADYDALVSRWHNPVGRRGRRAKAYAQRMHLYVELALKKHRLRHYPGADHHTLVNEIAQIRSQLIGLLNAAPVGSG